VAIDAYTCGWNTNVDIKVSVHNEFLE